MKFIFLILNVRFFGGPAYFEFQHFFSVVALALDRIPNELRATTIEIISQTKPTSSQKRALLLKNGLLKSTADELEALADIGNSNHLHRVHRTSHYTAF